MQININYTDIQEAVLRYLSIIGKRMYDEGGSSLYERVTFGSNEFPLIRDFTRSACNNIIASLHKLVSEHSLDSDNCCISYTCVDGARDRKKEDMINGSAIDYVVSFVLSRWLSVVMASMAEYYVTDASTRLENLVSLVFTPRSSGTIDFSLNKNL